MNIPVQLAEQIRENYIDCFIVFNFDRIIILKYYVMCGRLPMIHKVFGSLKEIEDKKVSIDNVVVFLYSFNKLLTNIS